MANRTIKSAWGRNPITVDARIPHSTLRYKVGWMHVGKSPEHVEATIRGYIEKARDRGLDAWTSDLEEDAVRFALWVHEENRAEYDAVMGGGW